MAGVRGVEMDRETLGAIIVPELSVLLGTTPAVCLERAASDCADAVLAALAEERKCVCDECRSSDAPETMIHLHERCLTVIERRQIATPGERAELNALRGFYQALDCTPWGRLNRAHFDALAAQWGVPRLARPPEVSA